MEKMVTLSGSVVTGKAVRGENQGRASETRRDRLKVWQQIYRDVKRQWEEAELGQAGRYRYGGR